MRRRNQPSMLEPRRRVSGNLSIPADALTLSGVPLMLGTAILTVGP